MTNTSKNILAFPNTKKNQLRMELPSPKTKRWVARRKAQVVMAVQAGVISLTEACERYSLSVEEFLCWQRAIENNGLKGLRATRVQRYRTNAVGDTGKP